MISYAEYNNAVSESGNAGSNYSDDVDLGKLTLMRKNMKRDIFCRIPNTTMKYKDLKNALQKMQYLLLCV